MISKWHYIEPVTERDDDTSLWKRIHAVHHAAYAQEAQLLGFGERVQDFPPMRCSAEDLRSDARGPMAAQYWIARAGNIGDDSIGPIVDAAVDRATIVGAISVEPPHVAIWSGEKINSAHIASLTVLPSHQRRGIGRALVAAAIAEFGHGTMTVSTGVLNEPALSLYASCGFVEHRRKSVSCGDRSLELALLQRPANALTAF